FIHPLQDGRTFVIAAAPKDRRSFGCADENDFTYFGRAFFKESLPKAASFQDAFRKAEGLVDEWERKDFAQQAKAGPAGPAAPPPPRGPKPPRCRSSTPGKPSTPISSAGGRRPPGRTRSEEKRREDP